MKEPFREDRQEVRAQGGEGDVQQAFTETLETKLLTLKQIITAVFPLIHPGPSPLLFTHIVC